MSEREKKIEEAGLAIETFNYLDASILFLIMFYHRKGNQGWMPRGEFTISLVGERFFWQKISKVFRPAHIEWGTIRPYHVLLYARPVGFPKRAAPSGIRDIHYFHHRNPLNVNKLVQNKALYNRRNYHIII